MAPIDPNEFPPLGVAGIGGSVRLSVRGTDAVALHDSLEHAWARCLVPADPQARLITAGLGTPSQADEIRASDPDLVAVRSTQAITRALIESQTGRVLMLHAGAVAHPETGRTVVFAAPGGTGKTTLVRLLSSRYGYLTDETVAIDADHRVLPYPKPLSVRRPDAPKAELSPDDLGLLPAPAEPTVVRLCLLDRDDRHTAPEAVELGLLDAITELTPQTSALYALPEGLRTLARLIEATGPVLRLRYAEAEDLLPLVDALLGETQPRHPGLAPGSPPDPSSAHAGDPRLRGDDGRERGDDGRESGEDATKRGDDGTERDDGREPREDGKEPGDDGTEPLRVRANRFADILERDGEALVLLREGGLLRLNPLGAAIVEFAVNPIRLDALAAALERRFGTPDGVDLLEATAQRVRELAAQGALILGEPPLPDAPGPYWRISDDTAFTVSSPERVVVFNLATPAEQPQALVGTAAAIWQFLTGDEPDPRPWIGEAVLIAELADAYATHPAAIAPDVQAFLTRMHSTGHLTCRPPD